MKGASDVQDENDRQSEGHWNGEADSASKDGTGERDRVATFDEGYREDGVRRWYRAL